MLTIGCLKFILGRISFIDCKKQVQPNVSYVESFTLGLLICVCGTDLLMTMSCMDSAGNGNPLSVIITTQRGVIIYV